MIIDAHCFSLGDLPVMTDIGLDIENIFSK